MINWCELNGYTMIGRLGNLMDYDQLLPLSDEHTSAERQRMSLVQLSSKTSLDSDTASRPEIE